jgi:MFS family permease
MNHLSGPTAPARPLAHTAVPVALLFTFMNSLATGVTFNGISFITRDAFSYGLGANCALGVLLGVTYVAGALSTGPAFRALGRRLTWWTPRTTLTAMMLIAGALNALPVAAWFLTDPQHRASVQWPLWVFIALYSLLCGGLWPIVESYVTGGRPADRLSRIVGRFNVLWSSALVFSMFAVALVPKALAQVPALATLSSDDLKICTLATMAALHLLSIIPLRLGFDPVPGEHPHGEHQSPPSFNALLRLHRGLMPLGYTVSYALSPFLPVMTDKIGVRGAWAEILASLWLAARVACFVILDRWHGWIGTKFTAFWGTLGVYGGFALCVVATLVGEGPAGIAIACVGLVAFGAGLALIYVAALYYAMHVGGGGQNSVDEGGKHEALIGAGYTVGPLCGLGAVGLASAGMIGVGLVNPAMLGLVALASAGGALAIFRR